MALDHVVDAAQQVVTDRLELVKLEARVGLGEALRAGGYLFSAVLLGGLAWVAAMLLLYVALGASLAPSARLALIVGLNLLAAAAFVAAGVKHLRGMEKHGHS